MTKSHHIAVSGQNKCGVPQISIKETGIELTPEAEAKAANALPRSEQMGRFEIDLAAHDNGNGPA